MDYWDWRVAGFLCHWCQHWIDTSCGRGWPASTQVASDEGWTLRKQMKQHSRFVMRRQWGMKSQTGGRFVGSYPKWTATTNPPWGIKLAFQPNTIRTKSKQVKGFKTERPVGINTRLHRCCLRVTTTEGRSRLGSQGVLVDRDAHPWSDTQWLSQPPGHWGVHPDWIAAERTKNEKRENHALGSVCLRHLLSRGR